LFVGDEINFKPFYLTFGGGGKIGMDTMDLLHRAVCCVPVFPLTLRLLPLYGCQHNWDSGYHTHGCNYPRDDLDDLDLMALGESSHDLRLYAIADVSIALDFGFSCA
jgi:hypothetical protein